jgi:hypothetical protein
VPTFRSEYVVRVRTIDHAPNAKARFLCDLTNGTVLDRLAELEVTTRRRPCARTVGARAFAKQDEAISYHQYGYADARDGRFHGLDALTVKLRGRPEAPLERRGRTLSSSARGA